MGMSPSKPVKPAMEDHGQKKPQLPLPRVGSVLGGELKDVKEDFKIGTQIGTGKFSITYLCKEISTGKKYACKSVPKRRLVIESEKEDLKREITIMEYLKDQDYVVTLKGIYEDRTYLHLVMEYCEGGELYPKLEKCRLCERTAAQIFSSIMKHVYGLHFMGVMHRDLKPENFLLEKRAVLGCIPCFADYSKLKVIDFGLSTYIDEGNPPWEKVGTAFYVAPEVLKRRQYGKEVDIWSAGVILYMLLTRAPPFPGETEEEIFDAIKKANPDMSNCPWKYISEPAKQLVKAMLSPNPKERPTAYAVLKHQWMKDNGVVTENPVDKWFLDTMMRFGDLNRFKKLALMILTEVSRDSSPAEFEGPKAMFRNFDTGQKKVISHEELEKSLVKLGSDLDSKQVKMIFDAADIDKNGFIDEKEFITAMTYLRKQHEEKHLEMAFKRFQKDEKGNISKEELKGVLEEYKMGDEATIEEIISDINKNKVGGIDYEEFCRMIRS